jgi:class 3 adenylate cyclase
MPDDPLPRRLTTIVALDVAGYSARTEADEAKTTAEVAALRRVIEGIATAQGGRVFNTAGDGFMLEFGSSWPPSRPRSPSQTSANPRCGSAYIWAMSWCSPTAISSATASTSRPA